MAASHVGSAEALEIVTIETYSVLMIVPACLVLSFVEARRMKQEGQSVQWKNIANVYHLVHGRFHHYVDYSQIPLYRMQN